MFKSILVAVAVLFAAAAAQAENATQLDVYEFGTYRSAPGVEVGKTRAGFSHKHIEGIELIESTRVVVAQLGGAFGFRFRAMGNRPGSAVPLTIVVHFPPDGMMSGDGKTAVTGDEYVENAIVGDDEFLTWKFDNRSDLVPGVWVIEIYEGNKRLTEQPFKVILPPVS